MRIDMQDVHDCYRPLSNGIDLSNGTLNGLVMPGTSLLDIMWDMIAEFSSVRALPDRSGNELFMIEFAILSGSW